MEHECIRTFPTRKIDDCSGIGTNKCTGTNPMVLEIWFEAQDGTECYHDNWMVVECNFCPFCGLKSDGLEEK